jgi:membrane-bound ClpP family serine protease
MLTAILLLIIGLLAVLIEFFLPGAIFGAIGALFIISAVVVFIQSSDSAVESVLFLIGTIIALIATIKFALWRIKASTGSLYLKSDQKGYVASEWDRSLVGKRGVVLSDLKPGGHILIEGVKHAAVSKSGYITKGEEVIVLDGEGDSLIVQKQ